MASNQDCKYGTKCYRKSEEHRKKFNHPARKTNNMNEDDESDQDLTSQPSKRQKLTGSEKQDQDQHSSETEVQDLVTEELQEDLQETCPLENEDADEIPSTPPNIDIKEELRLKFKVEMPPDFFDFWDYCKSINNAKPSEALKEDVGLILGGPYDVMAGRLKCVKGQRPNYLLHHRFFYDPPEFQTVLVGDDKKQHHLGYYRDEPQKAPVFMASNSAKENCTITPQGENIFAAVKLHIDKLTKQTKEKKKLEDLKKVDKSLTDWAKKCKHSLEARTKRMKDRDKKVVTKTFHKAGIVVPLDSTGVGYRELPETDGDLKKILKKIVESETEAEKARYSDALQEIITLVQFANDECDYGQGYELGLDLFCFGHERFHSMIGMLLSVAYQLLGREVFGEILDAHLKDRKKDQVSLIL
ncbi:histone PARylation factor 1-like [Lytechinus variegatus]|uniref:histone PARylation factor 1-like n=1 Tax=Lytechinus variegatus TaxID=7654 RepID=UPI001BB2AEAE|nr:histone PARylation factor 1-like [Lytechinus variegatus]